MGENESWDDTVPPQTEKLPDPDPPQAEPAVLPSPQVTSTAPPSNEPKTYANLFKGGSSYAAQAGVTGGASSSLAPPQSQTQNTAQPPNITPQTQSQLNQSASSNQQQVIFNWLKIFGDFCLMAFYFRK